MDENLRSLLERAKSGSYRAPPVRRVWIPKGTGPETRPIGIPTLEDKVLQRAVVMILESVKGDILLIQLKSRMSPFQPPPRVLRVSLLSACDARLSVLHHKLGPTRGEQNSRVLHHGPRRGTVKHSVRRNRVAQNGVEYCSILRANELRADYQRSGLSRSICTLAALTITQPRGEFSNYF
jgi:hypothetical protein